MATSKAELTMSTNVAVVGESLARRTSYRCLWPMKSEKYRESLDTTVGACSVAAVCNISVDVD